METATTTRKEVLDSLAVDLAKEHGAIIQYLLHAAQMRDTVLRWSIMSAAREEMWHFEWLTEAIRDRGGTPTPDRQEQIFTSEGLVRSLDADVEAENDALHHYEETLAHIGDSDEELTALIQRIMDDERYHRTSFTNMATKVGTEGGDVAFAAKPAISPTDAQSSAPMVGLEYSGLLQYLWNKYGSADKAAAETYFELAINEMRHLNWVASCMGGLGVPPVPPNPAEHVAAPRNATDARAVADRYEQQAKALIAQVREKLAGEQIATELRRIDYQHGYHRFQLEHMQDGG